MNAAARLFRRWYGARPWHLLAQVAAFGLAGYAVGAVADAGQWRGFALWFTVAIVGHDLVLFPLYSLADLALSRLLPGSSWPAALRSRPPLINYIRVPAAFSLLLLLVWFPLILGLSAGPYHRASGLAAAPYLRRWLAVVGVMFAVSAACYALRWRRMSPRPRRRVRAGPRRARVRWRSRLPRPPRQARRSRRTACAGNPPPPGRC
ncbi:MAG TPA: hypothetical protein VHY31_07055 [Streptosporangiaceae bacterium]|nr:hypothetical protein [Streptosporangiaceae bacterium]